MKQTLLPLPRQDMEDKQRKLRAIVLVLLLAALGINVLLTVLHTRQTHTLMLILNIMTDLAALWTVTYLCTAKLFPMRKLLCLDAKQGQEISGTVEAFPAETERYLGMDCRLVTISGKKLFVVDNGTISFVPSEQVTVFAVQRLVKEVER